MRRRAWSDSLLLSNRRRFAHLVPSDPEKTRVVRKWSCGWCSSCRSSSSTSLTVSSTQTRSVLLQTSISSSASVLAVARREHRNAPVGGVLWRSICSTRKNFNCMNLPPLSSSSSSTSTTTTPASSVSSSVSTSAVAFSSKQQHSTASSIEFVHSCPSIFSSAGASAARATTVTKKNTNIIDGTAFTAVIQPPHPTDLRTLFIASAIPMVGFGFMDQFVLIQAGGYIDATLGVSLGLATMTAAAAGMLCYCTVPCSGCCCCCVFCVRAISFYLLMETRLVSTRRNSLTIMAPLLIQPTTGQVVSDVSGVLFGGALERLLTRLSLIQTPDLSIQQRQLPICRNVSMAGAVVGVIIGCALGALTLLSVDLEARHRVERAQRLRDIVDDMISSPSDRHHHNHSPATLTKGTFPCDSCTVFVVSTRDLTLPKDTNDTPKQKKQSVQRPRKTYMKAIHETNSNDVHECVDSRSLSLSHDRQTLYAPLVKYNEIDVDEVLAVIAFQYGGDNEEGFTEDDVLTCRVMARHIAIFMDRLVD